MYPKASDHTIDFLDKLLKFNPVSKFLNFILTPINRKKD